MKGKRPDSPPAASISRNFEKPESLSVGHADHPAIPDDKAALKFSRTARWDGFNEDELSYLAARAGLPERLVIGIARETVARFREVWAKERGHLPLHSEIAGVIDRQLQIVPLAGAR